MAANNWNKDDTDDNNNDFNEINTAVKNLIRAVRNKEGSTDQATASNSQNESKERKRSSLVDVVQHARNMIGCASRNGGFNRLKSKERLRSMPYSAKAVATKPKVHQLKSFKFVLVSPPDDYVDIPGQTFVLSEDLIIVRGIIEISNSSKEVEIKQSLASAIATSHPCICDNDLEFLVANRRTISKPASSCSYDFNQVKLLAGQGALYIKLKAGMEFLLNPLNSDDEDLKPALRKQNSSTIVSPVKAKGS